MINNSINSSIIIYKNFSLTRNNDIQTTNNNKISIFQVFIIFIY